MKCADLLRLLNDYVDGDITVDACGEFDRHLSDCDPCRVVVDTIRKTITLYRENEEFELPEAVRSRLHEQLRQRWREKGNAEQDEG